MDDKNKKEIIFYSILGVLLIGFLVFFIIVVRSEGLGAQIKNFTNFSSDTKSTEVYKDLNVDLFEEKKFKSLKEDSFERKDFSKGKKNPFEPFQK